MKCTHNGFCPFQDRGECKCQEKFINPNDVFYVSKLQQEMLKRGINQAELGKLLGLSQAAVGKWLNGKNKITNKNKLKIQQLCEGEQEK